MSDDELWNDFQRRFGPGGSGDPAPKPTPASGPRPKKSTAAPEAALSADDADAWARYTAGFAAPTPPQPVPAKDRPAPRAPAAPALSADDTNAWAAFVSDLATGSVEIPEEPEALPPPPPPVAPPVPAAHRPMEFDRRVDLHGKTRQAAAALLGQRLMEARMLGLETLLVVTGKGLHSQQGPVLRDWLPQWARQQADGAPLRCEPAAASQGGSGAWMLWVAASRTR